MGADDKFLYRFERELHDWTTDGIVFVVHAVDRDVDVASSLAIDGKNGVAVFRRIVGVSGFHAGSEIGEIGDVAAQQRKFFDFGGGNVLADVGFALIDDRGFASDFDGFSDRTRLELDIYA